MARSALRIVRAIVVTCAVTFSVALGLAPAATVGCAPVASTSAGPQTAFTERAAPPVTAEPIVRDTPPPPPEPAASAADIDACEAPAPDDFDARLHIDLAALRRSPFAAGLADVPESWARLWGAADHVLVAFERAYRVRREIRFVGRPRALDAAIDSFAPCAGGDGARCPTWRHELVRESATCAVLRLAVNPVAIPYRDPSTGRLAEEPPRRPAAPFVVAPHQHDTFLEFEVVPPGQRHGGFRSGMWFATLSRVRLQIAPDATGSVRFTGRIEGAFVGTERSGEAVMSALAESHCGGDASLLAVPYTAVELPAESAITFDAELDRARAAHALEVILERLHAAIALEDRDELGARVSAAGSSGEIAPRVRVAALDAVRDLVRVEDDPELDRRLRRGRFNALADGGNRRAALAAADALLADPIEAPDPDGMQSYDRRLISERRLHLLAQLGDRPAVDAALAVHLQACSAETPDGWERLAACVLVAEVALESGDVERARGVRDLIVASRRPAADPELEARAVLALGALLHAEGHDDELLTFARRDRSAVGRDALRPLLAMARARAQPPAAAIATLTEYVDADHPNHLALRPWELAPMLVELGRLLAAQGRRDDALVRFRQAEALVERWLLSDADFALRIRFDALVGRIGAGDAEARGLLEALDAEIFAILPATDPLSIEAAATREE